MHHNTQRVFYFPIKSKLKALLRVPNYRHMLEHEFSRPHNPRLFSDVYDAPAWKEFMGDIVAPNNRIGLQFCVDGIPAFSANTLSLKPAEFVNLSLPPSVRSKVENILLLMLLPSKLKADQAKKYYDFAAKFELNDLFHQGWDRLLFVNKTIILFLFLFIHRITQTTGIDGVKVKVFSTTMDTPGRSELLGK